MIAIALLLVAGALAQDACKLSTKINGQQLNYDINILKREFDESALLIVLFICLISFLEILKA